MSERAGPRAERPAMADYGVPVDDPSGLLPWSWAEERLVACRNYWVGTVSPAGAPHSMPVWGVWLTDPDRFEFGCARSSAKNRYLESNPRIVVTVEDTVECVSVQGIAEPLSFEEFGPGLEVFLAKYSDDMATEPGQEADASSFAENAAWRVRPVRAFAVIERPDDFGPRATRWTWERPTI